VVSVMGGDLGGDNLARVGVHDDAFADFLIFSFGFGFGTMRTSEGMV
jgi:hypothetical protein